jgi:Holliday junction resolvase
LDGESIVTNSRQKGKRGELEVVHLLKSYGFEARRGQQFKGTEDSPDVVHNMDGFFIEVKLRQAFNLHATIDQADNEKGSHEVAVVFHRKNDEPWLVTMYATDWVETITELFDDVRP